MAVVNIPAALRPLAGGSTQVEVEGTTLREVVDSLEEQFAGIRDRIVDGDRIRPGLAVFIDGTQAPQQLSTRVHDGAEIYFAPAVAGGC